MTRPTPQVSITHNDVVDPQYTPTELDGLRTEATRLTQHIKILEEEVVNKRAQLKGLEKIIADNSQQNITHS